MPSFSLEHVIPYRTLHTGARIPAIGLGTFGSDSVTAPKIALAVIQAAEIGYRHFDCASVYGNERKIGEALARVMASGIPRERLWITSKVWNSCHALADVEKPCLKSIADLGVEYLDVWSTGPSSAITIRAAAWNRAAAMRAPTSTASTWPLGVRYSEKEGRFPSTLRQISCMGRRRSTALGSRPSGVWRSCSTSWSVGTSIPICWLPTASRWKRSPTPMR